MIRVSGEWTLTFTRNFTMFPFEDLTGSGTTTSFAYWILVEKQTLAEGELDLAELQSFMAYHYDSEEQAYEPDSILDDERFKKLQPIAPVTLAERWTPFSMCCEALGDPVLKMRGEGNHSAAMGVWDSTYLGGFEPQDRSEHARHFVFLLRLACSLAEEIKGRIVIFGSPGWSYSHWKNEAFMMNPDTAILMHKAGYFYTDRIAQ